LPAESDVSNWQRGDILIGRYSVCRRKIEMTPGAQSRDDTQVTADTTSATRHHS
jgi:hypothetical protein